MINIWKPSSIGVGAVVGGEVFNVLVIIGTAVLATPKEYLPLKLSKLSFCRDPGMKKTWKNGGLVKQHVVRI